MLLALAQDLGQPIRCKIHPPMQVVGPGRAAAAGVGRAREHVVGAIPQNSRRPSDGLQLHPLLELRGVLLPLAVAVGQVG